MTARIGPRMEQVMEMVRRAGPAGMTRLDVVEAVGPHGSRQYGYRTVDRCLLLGLVELAAPLPGRRGATLVVRS